MSTVPKVDFYYLPGSPPCGAVLMAAKAAGVELNQKLVDLEKGEQNSPEFVKINPQHTVPVVVDNGLSIVESRAILQYFANKYAKDDTLYPKDAVKRALVDQKLFFDGLTLYQSYCDYYYPVMLEKATRDAKKFSKIEEAFGYLNGFLDNSKFVAGDHFTIADIAILATVTTFEVSRFDISRYPNVVRWLKTARATAPGYEETNGKNVLSYKNWFDKIWSKSD